MESFAKLYESALDVARDNPTVDVCELIAATTNPPRVRWIEEEEVFRAAR